MTDRDRLGADSLREIREHELKCVPPFFQAVVDGVKPFEARKHDRPFADGDTLRLREYADNAYTGRECARVISYVLVGGEFGIEYGYVVLGLSDPALVAEREALLERIQREKSIADEYAQLLADAYEESAALKEQLLGGSEAARVEVG